MHVSGVGVDVCTGLHWSQKSASGQFLRSSLFWFWSQSLTGLKLMELAMLDDGQWIWRICLSLLSCAGITNTSLQVGFLKYLFISWVLRFKLRSLYLYSKHFTDWAVLLGSPPLSRTRSNNTAMNWWSLCISLPRAGMAGVSHCSWFSITGVSLFSRLHTADT